MKSVSSGVDNQNNLKNGIGLATATSAIIAAAFYFIGWQYKQSLALAFGLPSYPGDISFQGNVASGVSILDSQPIYILVTVLIFTYFSIRIIEFIPKILDNWRRYIRLEALKTKRHLRGIAKFRNENFEETNRELSHIDKKTDALLWRTRFMLPLIRFFSYSKVFVFTIIVGAGLIFLVFLFYVGHYIAQTDAKYIRQEARGRCDGCFVYSVEPEPVLGVPVFQSSTEIYVQEYDGLYRVSIEKLDRIQTFQRTEKKPLTLPRR